MNIKEIAIQCGTEFTQYKQVNFTYEFTPSQLEQFAKAVIAAYVAEQKPVAWCCAGEAYSLKAEADAMEIELGYKVFPLFTLEGVKS